MLIFEYIKLTVDMQQKPQETVPKLSLQLLYPQYHRYQNEPEQYLLDIIVNNNPWPQKSSSDILKFLQSISRTYKNIPYHNLTHAFDVMINCDQFLTNYGWQQKIGLTEIERTFLLIAAYAHDSGHEGLNNAYYINSKHKIAENIKSPLQTMHLNNLKNLLREHDLQISPKTSQEITEMILKTDNSFHNWSLQKIQYLKSLTADSMKERGNSLIAKCILVHAADLNNGSKEFQLNLTWARTISLQFERQAFLQKQQGLKITCTKNNNTLEFYQSNFYFIDLMILPMYKGLSQLEKKFEKLYNSLLKNKAELEVRMKKQIKAQSQ